jgi:hypothetical protein
MTQWCPVVGFEEYYKISDEGNVLSLRRNIILKPSYSNSGGYPMVVLFRDGRQKGKYLHHLVLEAFIGPKPSGQEARHLDGDCRNPALSNLAWGTSSENKLDEIRHGTHYEASRTSCDNDHEWTEENTKIARYSDGSFKQRICKQCARDRSAALRTKRVTDNRRCGEPGCDKPYFGRGWCSMHYAQWRRGNRQ